MSFFKNEGQEGKTDPVWGWYQWKCGGQREMMKEGEYDGNIAYLCTKMEQ
jgi:hypothetical protein